MRLLLAALMTTLPMMAFAAGSDSSEPPEPTETSKDCKKGQIWDKKAKKCVDPKSSSISDDDRFQAARELAWAERPADALTVLAAMQEGETDRVLTYLGFAHRKAGDLDKGMAYYAEALEINPDNILVRSYLGQMLVEMGEVAAAGRQLEEIVARGGQGTWAEASLRQAVGSGQTFNY